MLLVRECAEMPQCFTAFCAAHYYIVHREGGKDTDTENHNCQCQCCDHGIYYMKYRSICKYMTTVRECFL